MADVKLPRRPLGKTGLEASVLSFGASPLGSVFEDIDEDEGVRAVHEAFKLGINYFDTSPFYGGTRSETVLGRALKDLPRDEIVVATKVGRYGPEDFDFSKEKVTSSVRESLQRLQVEYIDLIQCHDIEFVNLNQIVNETLPALVELKKQGLVRHIGITGLPLKAFRTVLDRVEPGAVDAVLSYCHCALNDKTLLEFVPYLQEKGLAVINGSVLSMGLLTDKGPPDWHPAPDSVKQAARGAVAAAKSHNCDIAKLAIMDAVRQGEIATNLVGCATVDQVRFNVNAALEGLGLVPPHPAAGEMVEYGLKAVQEALAPISGTSWPSGLHENN